MAIHGLTRGIRTSLCITGRAERRICSQQPDSRIIPPALGTSVWGTANVAKLVDALDLGSSGVTLGSSSLPIRTNSPCELNFPGFLASPDRTGMMLRMARIFVTTRFYYIF